MNTQVDKIEQDLERKVRDKDKLVKKLQQKCEMYEREKRMNEDLNEVINESQMLEKENKSFRGNKK